MREGAFFGNAFRDEDPEAALCFGEGSGVADTFASRYCSGGECVIQDNGGSCTPTGSVNGDNINGCSENDPVWSGCRRKSCDTTGTRWGYRQSCRASSSDIARTKYGRVITTYVDPDAGEPNTGDSGRSCGTGTAPGGEPEPEPEPEADDPGPTCGASDASCSDDADCCSGFCLGWYGGSTCW